MVVKIKDKRTNSVNPDEAAHDELPHLDPLCLQVSNIHFWCFKC